MTDIWTDALAGLRPRLGTETYELWLRPLVMVAAAQGVLRLRAPSLFMKEWFENHYRDAVLQEIFSQTEERYAIEVDVSEEAAPAPVFEPAIVPTPATTTAPSRRAAAPVGLSERYRFGTFIKGASNELAASAACAVAEEPGRRFNPLFLYGGVGLGKTHLLHAVGHALYEQRPDRRIVYLSAERFMNEFISAVRFNECDQFRKRYREDCDVLLVDDIQFIAGRDRTMDEFFHVFNALYEAGKQIMVTADRTPSDMQGMEERITSRLNWGLVADIKPPDLETRVAILRQKAEDERIAIADDVAVYLASLVRSNVRELEGALVRVSTFAALKGVPISQEFVREVIGDNAVQRPPQQLTVEAIQKAVAGYFSLRITDLKGQRRHKGVARPRMIAMYLSRELTGSSFPEIGLRFGGKDHSTVINACRRMAEMQTSDPELRTIIESLRQQLVGQG
ncbi:MAG: chromosomal replication initiator protein DnaA [Deltaproteobacteria bacterium]|nr:chromosomal replication initiator protein DnaA [Deltaproteobacteria bacterium]